jgi:ubiquinone/menaquinone biosynthesis C-methylase UbiE
MPIRLPDQLNSSEKTTLNAFLQLLETDEPSLEQIWASMDFVWDLLGCDNKSIDFSKLSKFYHHPIWLLNGLFVEQHQESMFHREAFADWIADQNPKRVADFGGGFGTLACMIADKCPNCLVDIVEPHPHPLALSRINRYQNLSFKPLLEGKYDVLVATDVFEHIPNPLQQVEKTSAHLKTGGKYLIANCFFPVIKCHLPSTFHLRYSWKYLLRLMNLVFIENVSYGMVFQKTGPVSLDKALFAEQASRMLFPILEYTLTQIVTLHRKWSRIMRN